MHVDPTAAGGALPNELGLAEASRAIAAGRLTSLALVAACLARIDEREAAVGAWECLDREAALARARELDAGPRRGLLHGIPLGVKDTMDTAAMVTTCGSPIYRGRRPQWDAACVALARRAGAIPLGKTVSTEFAYFAPGRTANPRNLAHTPGGSSSGSAAAVADMMVPATFASQTAASIIRPAAYCGVVGFKPSFARFSLAGVKPFAESLDTLGVIARSVEDAATLSAALDGATSSPDLEWRGRPPRIGLCRTAWWNEADAATRATIEAVAEALAQRGAAVGECVLPPAFDELIDLQKLVMAHEAAASLAYEYDSHRGLLSAQMVALLESGMRIPRAEYLEARARARDARREFAKVMGDWDALLTPSAASEAPRGLGATGDPLFARMWTLLHAPSITLPGRLGPGSMPIGVQLVTARDADDALLAVAAWAEPVVRGA